MSIIVTGAASGIGAATARLLGERRPDPLVLVDRTRDGLEAVADALSVEVLLVVGDLADTAFCEGLADRAAERFGEVRGVASIAGVTGGAPLAELTAAEFDRQIAINTRAT